MKLSLIRDLLAQLVLEARQSDKLKDEVRFLGDLIRNLHAEVVDN